MEESLSLKSKKEFALWYLNLTTEESVPSHVKQHINAYLAQLEKERDSAIELLNECRVQLEYLQQKFRETGSGNNVLSRVNTFLDSIDE
jgi:flagellar biosynthesis chaperone FliJ